MPCYGRGSYNAFMAKYNGFMAKNEESSETVEPAVVSDPGLRQLLTYTFIALAFALVLSLLAVYLVVRWFDAG